MNNQEFCPQCPNHCAKDEVRCGRGRAYFNLDNNSSHPQIQEQGIVGLLKQCGHILHHNPEIKDTLCNGLSKEEQQTLEQLLNKMLSKLK